MKLIGFLLLLILFNSCADKKGVYWCGDHPCINKKEREAYFKKTMIVEVRNLEKDPYKNNAEIDELIERAKLSEKKRIKDERNIIKNSKLKQKQKAKEEKILSKQAKIEEKKKIREEKKLIKEAKLKEKRKIKEEKELQKKISKDEKKLSKERKILSKSEYENKTAKNVEIKGNADVIDINQSKFNDIVEKIIRKNTFRPYPDINDIPN